MPSVRTKPQIGTAPRQFYQRIPLTAVRQAAKQSVPYCWIRGSLKIASVLFFCLFWPNYGQPQSVHTKTYSIQSISFEKYEFTSTINNIVIVFSQYGSEVRTKYPPSKDSIPQDLPPIIKKCKEALTQNIAEIIRIQKQNKSISNYLTFQNKVSLFGKKDYLNLVDQPQEQTVQIDSQTNKIIAEFRSQEFPVDNRTAFCVYLTFVYKPDEKQVEKIIISAVKLVGGK